MIKITSKYSKSQHHHYQITVYNNKEKHFDIHFLQIKTSSRQLLKT